MSLPTLCAIGGSIGTGKTTLAYGLRNKSSHLSNAIVLEGDQIRRELLEYDLSYTMTESDYNPEISEHVKLTMEHKIREALMSGLSVIDSSGFWTHKSQVLVETIANECNAHFIGLWLTASRPTQHKRISKRLREREKGEGLCIEKGHASDADEGVFIKCDKAIENPNSSNWRILNSEGSIDSVLRSAISHIG